MTPEQQVTNLELSRKLKELGVKQESLFWWIAPESPDRPLLYYGHYDNAFNKTNHAFIFSAYTVAELGELLGKKMLETYRNAGHVLLSSYGLPQFLEPTEADARAAMLVYLIENKLITL